MGLCGSSTVGVEDGPEEAKPVAGGTGSARIMPVVSSESSSSPILTGPKDVRGGKVDDDVKELLEKNCFLTALAAVEKRDVLDRLCMVVASWAVRTVVWESEKAVFGSHGQRNRHKVDVGALERGLSLLERCVEASRDLKELGEAWHLSDEVRLLRLWAQEETELDMEPETVLRLGILDLDKVLGETGPTDGASPSWSVPASRKKRLERAAVFFAHQRALLRAITRGRVDFEAVHIPVEGHPTKRDGTGAPVLSSWSELRSVWDGIGGRFRSVDIFVGLYDAEVRSTEANGGLGVPEVVGKGWDVSNEYRRGWIWLPLRWTCSADTRVTVVHEIFHVVENALAFGPMHAWREGSREKLPEEWRGLRELEYYEARWAAELERAPVGSLHLVERWGVGPTVSGWVRRWEMAGKDQLEEDGMDKDDVVEAALSESEESGDLSKAMILLECETEPDIVARCFARAAKFQVQNWNAPEIVEATDPIVLRAVERTVERALRLSPSGPHVDVPLNGDRTVRSDPDLPLPPESAAAKLCEWIATARERAKFDPNMRHYGLPTHARDTSSSTGSRDASLRRSPPRPQISYVLPSSSILRGCASLLAEAGRQVRFRGDLRRATALFLGGSLAVGRCYGPAWADMAELALSAADTCDAAGELALKYRWGSVGLQAASRAVEIEPSRLDRYRTLLRCLSRMDPVEVRAVDVLTCAGYAAAGGGENRDKVALYLCSVGSNARKVEGERGRKMEDEIFEYALGLRPDDATIWWKWAWAAHRRKDTEVHHARLARAAALGMDDAVQTLVRRGVNPDPAPMPAPVDLASLYPNVTVDGGGVRVGVFLINDGDSHRQVIRDEALGFLVNAHVTFHAGKAVIPALENIDVLLVPGGMAPAYYQALGDTDDERRAGRDAIRDFVNRGGGYIGICAGSFFAAAPKFLGLVPLQIVDRAHWARGIADVTLTPVSPALQKRLSLIPMSAPVPSLPAEPQLAQAVLATEKALRLDGPFRIRYAQGPIFAKVASVPSVPPKVPVDDDHLAQQYQNGMEVVPHETREGWPTPIFPDKEQDVHVLARYTKDSDVHCNGAPSHVMPDRIAMATTTFGSGKIFVSAPHPEYTRGMGFILSRAVLLVKPGSN